MKQELFSAHGAAIDKNGDVHVVTVVGVLETWRERVVNNDVVKYVNLNGNEREGVLLTSNKVLKKKLTMSFSICHPMDEFDENVGIGIAKRRIKEGRTLGTLETTCLTMLHENSIEAILKAELKTLIDNIENLKEP